MRVHVAGAIALRSGVSRRRCPGARAAIRASRSPPCRRSSARSRPLSASSTAGSPSTCAAQGPPEIRSRPRSTSARDAEADLTARLPALGANVRYASPRSGDVRAGVPTAQAQDDRRLERRRARRHRRRLPQRALRRPRESKAERAARVQAALARANALAAVASEGDRAHAADTARAAQRVTGVGTKLCALSDGVDSLAASQAAGELPAVDVLPDQAGDGDEGTAMLRDPARRRAGRRARLRDRVHQRRVVRRQHPRAALRAPAAT